MCLCESLQSVLVHFVLKPASLKMSEVNTQIEIELHTQSHAMAHTHMIIT